MSAVSNPRLRAAAATCSASSSVATGSSMFAQLTQHLAPPAQFQGVQYPIPRRAGPGLRHLGGAGAGTPCWQI